ncbi:MAG: hypothetical protein LBT62_05870 [Deltaproteobacteria bacterium]|jgi:hypothetical protein|nr:hypothetical protein [Deltaproteobacteria bacterium]
MNLSRCFLWIVVISSFVTLAALAGAVYLLVETSLELQQVKQTKNFNDELYRIKNYAAAQEIAPQEAKRILEFLDQALLSADDGEDETPLIGVADQSSQDAEPPAEDASQEPSQEPSEDASEAVSEDASEDPDAAELQPGETADLDEQAVWNSWHSLLNVPTDKPTIDVDDFKLSARGQISFVLRQNSQPGLRVKGRTIVMCLVEDKNGALSLMSAPEIDISKPEQGWEKGTKYNIIASKLMRAKMDLPEGAQVLNAEILAWEEDSKELIFLKKMTIEQRP